MSEENRFEAKFHLKKLWNCIKDINKNCSERKPPETISKNKNTCSLTTSSDTSSDEFDEFINKISVNSVNKYENNKDVNIAVLLESFKNIPRMKHAMSILDFWETKKLEEPPELFKLSQVKNLNVILYYFFKFPLWFPNLISELQI